MSERTQAEQYLLDQIRTGDESAWAELVRRYQGRLHAFAKKQIRGDADVDDLIQETFLSFLRGASSLDLKSSLESYLFTILRRRVIDFLRRQGRSHEFHVCDTDFRPTPSDDEHSTDEERIAGREPTASAHACEFERRRIQRELLWDALRETVGDLQRRLRLRDLQVFEMIFYAQMRNKDIADQLGVDEKRIALQKHRFVKRLADRVAKLAPSSSDSLGLPDEDVLTQLWEENRPSCPKRSTLGKYLLGTIATDWEDYVRFHIESLGCRICVASLDDMKQTASDATRDRLSQRILQSSVGFFARSGKP